MLAAVAAAAVTTFFYNPHPHPQIAYRHYALAGWRITVGRDRFTGALSCALKTTTIRYHRDTLIFHLGRDLETTHAVFRVDGGPARPVSEAFHEVEAQGFFPRRGWIDDPAGGDVALPAPWLAGTRRLWIRASPAVAPNFYNLSRFADALTRSRGVGCPAKAF